jgi:hypothetical protein
MLPSMQKYVLHKLSPPSYFVIRIEVREIDGKEKLDMSEKKMKMLLVSWVTRWLQHEKLSSWILSSWASVKKVITTSPSVDHVPPPQRMFPIFIRGVIFYVFFIRVFLLFMGFFQFFF